MIEEDKPNVSRKFDHGSAKENLKAYGTEVPPIYDPTNIKEKVHLFVGKYDKLANANDVNILAQYLQNYEIREYELGHGSFTLAKDMTYLEDALNIIQNSD
jgi:hypothetical protein